MVDNITMWTRFQGFSQPKTECWCEVIDQCDQLSPNDSQTNGSRKKQLSEMSMKYLNTFIRGTLWNNYSHFSYILEQEEK